MAGAAGGLRIRPFELWCKVSFLLQSFVNVLHQLSFGRVYTTGAIAVGKKHALTRIDTH
jgi:hypothetical protein